MCSLFAKLTKQQKTSTLIALTVLVSFCLGHAHLTLYPGWSEPIIIWVANILGTGRCKSAQHEFLMEILEDVASVLSDHGEEVLPMILPHCTWDKFGDLMAKGGGRSLGLYDELLSFFASMNMYSSCKNAVSDTKEYQDFLQMYTGKPKARATLTGNANFNMNRTSLALLGFTQPHTALPIIQDISNNVKGFTSRILWFFPKPIYTKYEDSKLKKEEIQEIDVLKRELVHTLAELYIHGQKTYNITEEGKTQVVTVNSTEFHLTNEAEQYFAQVHDNWEFNFCQKFEQDAIIGGLFSRGKSQMLRLTVPLHILLKKFGEDIDEVKANTDADADTDDDPNADANTDNDLDADADTDTDLDTDSDADDENELLENSGNSSNSIPVTNSQHEEQVSETEEDDTADLPKEFEENIKVSTQVGKDAISLSHSITNLCLTQICIMVDKQSVIEDTNEHHDAANDQTDAASNVPDNAINKLFKCVLLSPGRIVSFSYLSTKGIFRKGRHEMPINGKPLLVKVANEIETLEIGHVEKFQVSKNNSNVYFYIKASPPTDPNEAIQFSAKLARVGVTFPDYCNMFDDNTSESERNLSDWTKRNDGDFDSATEGTPTKRPKNN
ncbi:hypothetical protein AC249_AIPGENE27735 [Exaiptasia diaphana]|nr:hypothetical protein AC249_AIPGENE27735 [Exaiptasia diaphana]